MIEHIHGIAFQQRSLYPLVANLRIFTIISLRHSDELERLYFIIFITVSLQ